MIPSQSIIDFIKGYEQCRLRVYKDSVGKDTYGWGHLVLPGETFAGTQAEADRIFVDDLEKISRGLLMHISGIPSQQQFDAILSLAFNEGVTAIGNSTLLHYVNEGDFHSAAGEFPKWNKERVNGVLCVNDGLTKRRMAEQRIFVDGVYDSRH